MNSWRVTGHGWRVKRNSQPGTDLFYRRGAEVAEGLSWGDGISEMGSWFKFRFKLKRGCRLQATGRQVVGEL